MKEQQKSAELYLPEYPFRGLDSFRYADRDIFSERNEEKLQLYNLINVYKACLLYGKSGVGKSSLVAAGLIPLIEMHYQPEIIRVYPKVDGTFIISKLLIDEKKQVYQKSLFDPEDKLGQKIALSCDDFEKLVNDYCVNKSPETRNIPVLIFDQFEELITYFEEANQTGGEDSLSGFEKTTLQGKIITLLQKLYYNSALRIKMVFAFREDYLAKFTKLFEAIPDLCNYFLRITAIPTERLHNIIAFPFVQDIQHEKYKEHFTDAFIKLLHDKILEYFGDDDILLTDVQIVCLFLYKMPAAEREAFLQSTDIGKILEQFYFDVLNKFDEKEKQAAITILSVLVLNERTRNIFHHEQIIKEYHKETGAENTEITEQERMICETVLLKLENEAKIIRKEERNKQDYFEIRSEAIIPRINELKVEKAKQDIIKETAREREIERKKRNRELLYILGLVSLMILGAVYYFFQQKKNIQLEKQGQQAKLEQQRQQAKLDSTKQAAKLQQQLQQAKIEQQLQQAKIEQQLQRAKLDSIARKQQLTVFQQQERLVIALKKLNAQAVTTAKLQEDKLRAQDELDDLNKKLTDTLTYVKALYKAQNTNIPPADRIKYAKEAYNALSQAQKDRDAFTPDVYSALVSSMTNQLRNSKLATRSSYNHPINGVLNINDNLYFNIPFTAITDNNATSLFENKQLLRSWIDQTHNRLAILVLGKDNFKKLIFIDRNNKDKRIDSVSLAYDQDITSLIFDGTGNKCVYATRFPSTISKFKIQAADKPAVIWPQAKSNGKTTAQTDNYIYLAGKSNKFIAITTKSEYIFGDISLADIHTAPLNLKNETILSIADCDKGIYIGCKSGVVYLMNPLNTFPLIVKHNNSKIVALACSNDGEWLAAGYVNTAICLWNIKNNLATVADVPSLSYSGGEGISFLAFDDHKNTLIAVTSTGSVFNFPLSMKALVNK